MQVLQSGEWTHTQFHNDPQIPVEDGSIVRYVLDSLIVVVHGDYFWENFPQNTSLLQWLLLLIFSSFPNTTIITLKNVNNSGQRVSKFPQNFSKCPHNTIIPLSILNIFLKSPQNTLIPQTLLLRSLE